MKDHVIWFTVFIGLAVAVVYTWRGIPETPQRTNRPAQPVSHITIQDSGPRRQPCPVWMIETRTGETPYYGEIDAGPHPPNSVYILLRNVSQVEVHSVEMIVSYSDTDDREAIWEDGGELRNPWYQTVRIIYGDTETHRFLPGRELGTWVPITIPGGHSVYHSQILRVEDMTPSTWIGLPPLTMTPLSMYPDQIIRWRALHDH